MTTVDVDDEHGSLRRNVRVSWAVGRCHSAGIDWLIVRSTADMSWTDCHSWATLMGKSAAEDWKRVLTEDYEAGPRYFVERREIPLWY